jgi:hypothetical protein
MDPKDAVQRFQYGEHIKTALITASQLEMSLPSYPEKDRAGGQRMLIALLEGIRGDAGVAFSRTDDIMFQNCSNQISMAISQIESGEYETAAATIGGAVSAATTAAMKAWEYLAEHGLI